MTDLEVMLNYRRLKDLRRCNNLPTLVTEDVAQHSYFTTMLAMAIGDEYNTYVTEHNLGFHPLDVENQLDEFKMEIVLRKALCHDTEEAFIGDIPWNIKHQAKDLFDELTDAHMDKMYKDTKTMELYHKLNRECKVGLEGQLVNVVDMLELVVYCWEEYVKGNKFIKPLLDKAIRRVKAMELSTALYSHSPLFKAILDLCEYPGDGKVAEYVMDIDGGE